jgi:hypothetical protein
MRQVIVKVPGALGIAVADIEEERREVARLIALGFDVTTKVTRKQATSTPKSIWVLHVMHTSGVTKLKFKALAEANEAAEGFGRMGYDTHVIPGVDYAN